MAKYQHTEGICLRRIDYSNTSQVAAFLTPDRGRLSFIAKGVTRAPKKGVRTSFDLLARYEILYTERRHTSLQNLTYRWLREDFRGLRMQPERILCGYYVAELALNFTAEHNPCPEFYEAVLSALRRFAAGDMLGVNVLLLELAALAEHGSTPALSRCAECGRRLSKRGAIAFNPAAGGALCRRCESSAAPHLPARTTHVRRDVLAGLASIAHSPDTAPTALAPRSIVSMSIILRFHMRYLLSKELRMWDYLGRRKLSRSLEQLRCVPSSG